MKDDQIIDLTEIIEQGDSVKINNKSVLDDADDLKKSATDADDGIQLEDLLSELGGMDDELELIKDEPKNTVQIESKIEADAKEELDAPSFDNMDDLFENLEKSADTHDANKNNDHNEIDEKDELNDLFDAIFDEEPSPKKQQEDDILESLELDVPISEDKSAKPITDNDFDDLFDSLLDEKPKTKTQDDDFFADLDLDLPAEQTKEQAKAMPENKAETKTSDDFSDLFDEMLEEKPAQKNTDEDDILGGLDLNSPEDEIVKPKPSISVHVEAKAQKQEPTNMENDILGDLDFEELAGSPKTAELDAVLNEGAKKQEQAETTMLEAGAVLENEIDELLSNLDNSIDDSELEDISNISQKPAKTEEQEGLAGFNELFDSLDIPSSGSLEQKAIDKDNVDFNEINSLLGDDAKQANTQTDNTVANEKILELQDSLKTLQEENNSLRSEIGAIKELAEAGFAALKVQNEALEKKMHEMLESQNNNDSKNESEKQQELIQELIDKNETLVQELSEIKASIMSPIFSDDELSNIKELLQKQLVTEQDLDEIKNNVADISSAQNQATTLNPEELESIRALLEKTENSVSNFEEIQASIKSLNEDFVQSESENEKNNIELQEKLANIEANALNYNEQLELVKQSSSQIEQAMAEFKTQDNNELENTIFENLKPVIEKYAASSAAKIIREEIAALLSE